MAKNVAKLWVTPIRAMTIVKPSGACSRTVRAFCLQATETSSFADENRLQPGIYGR
jgi:hypothetical protein